MVLFKTSLDFLKVMVEQLELFSDYDNHSDALIVFEVFSHGQHAHFYVQIGHDYSIL